MPHDHHHHTPADVGDRRLGVAIAVNLGLSLAQIAGGLLSGSLALIADAIHNLSDAASLVIAFAARRIARRPADAAMPFGYGRAEAVAALVNYTSLILLGLWLGAEAVTRLLDPWPVAGWTVVALAGLALAVDIVTALLTRSMAAGSANIRAAFLHNLGDALTSVAVILSGIAILLFGWWIVDPLVTLAISAGILWLALREIGGTVRLLMNAAPPGGDARALVATLAAEEGVTGIHHARLWMSGEHSATFQAHVVIAPGRWGEADAIKSRLKRLLAERFRIADSTLELECAAHACRDAPLIG